MRFAILALPLAIGLAACSQEATNNVETSVTNTGDELGNYFEEAGNWAGNAATDAGNWTTNAADDVGDSMSNVGSAIGNEFD